MFWTPSNIMVVGPSGSGKTVFASKLLQKPKRLTYFDPRSRRVHYCYGPWQPLFSDLKRLGVRLHKGLPTEPDLKFWFGSLLISDDLMTEGTRDKNVLGIFTKYSHHRNIAVLLLNQDMIPGGH